MNWIPFFSQTGSEICNIIEKTNLQPTAIITNNHLINSYDYRMYKWLHKIILIDEKPTVEQYLDNLNMYITEDEYLITLHGFLRIIPSDVLQQFKMYNMHPGLITKYEILKGKDPQKKAFNLKLPTSGCVIHEVSDVLDGGRIVLQSQEIDISNLQLSDIIKRLKEEGLKCWLQFFAEEMNNK